MPLDDTTLSIIKRLVREHFRAYAPRYAVAFLLMGIFAACTALSAWLMKDVVNRIFVDQNRQALVWIPAVIAAVFIAKGFAAYFQEVTLSRIGNQLVAQTQKRMFDHILKMDAAFFQAHPSSELVTYMTQNANAARQMMNVLAVGLGRDLFTLVSLVLVMIALDPIMAVISLIGGPIAAIGLKRLVHRIKKVAQSEYYSLATIVTTMREASQGIRIVKSFQLEDAMRKRMLDGITAIERVNNRIVNVQARVNPLIETVGGVAVAGVVLYAGWRTLSHGQTPGEFFAFMTALLMAADPLRRLSKLQLQVATSAVGVKMIYALLDTPAAEAETGPTRQLAIAGGEVRFENVSFAYTPGVFVLRELSFTASPGKTTALVGLSGSGKTTIFNLIQRFWNPSQGHIRIDGQAISDVSLSSLRRQVALVSQDVFLFEGTIRDNITAGLDKHTEEAIVAAARAAHADAFIRGLPNGYDTLVGELGAQISGGQRQRISIARAFLKNAPIILLDEPTSALDSETEQFIQSALKDLTRGRTTIVIAHRLATVANADLIHVLDAGKLVESGTHRELVRRDGLYARLHRIQFAEPDRDAPLLVG